MKTNRLSADEMKKLKRLFCPRDIEILLSKFSIEDIKKVLSNKSSND